MDLKIENFTDDYSEPFPAKPPLTVHLIKRFFNAVRRMLVGITSASPLGISGSNGLGDLSRRRRKELAAVPPCKASASFRKKFAAP
jgi:hypothetical protein